MELSKEKKLLERIERAVELIESSEIDEGLNILRLCEDRLDLFKDSELDLKLIVYHNLSMCFQITQDFEECCRYLEKTIKVAKLRENLQDIEKIRNSRYICMLYIQQGAIFSHIGSHEEAVSSAKQAFNYVSQSYQHCVQYASTFKSLSDYHYQNYKTLESCLLFLSGKISRFPLNCGKIIQRSSLGVIHYTDWIYSFTINDILDIKPLKYFEVKNSHTFLAEISKDFMLEKICLLLTSCYLIATESRLLDDQNEVKKAKGWHSRAVEIGLVMMPLETPLLQHIKTSYEKHYPVVVQKITKVSKSKTPVKESRQNTAKNKTPLRTKASGQRKVIKDIEIKTERSYVREKLDKIEKGGEGFVKYKTQREDNQEPEPPLSQDYKEEPINAFLINSNDLYGVHSDDD